MQNAKQQLKIIKSQCQNPKSKSIRQPADQVTMTKKYDLKERTAAFSVSVIKFVQTLPRNEVNRPLISQLVRSSTSVGANYVEADGAESKKDFKHKIAICKKEAKETMYWFQMLVVANEDKKQDCRILWQEAHELALIFASIINSSNRDSLGFKSLRN